MPTSLITIFTPTYNRAYCLHKCYQSLCRQIRKDFIWLIIDDGSTDNTKELVDSWLSQDNGFKIQYVWKENGGMHTAYNTAYELIQTELCMNIDSDDYVSDNAIDNILSFWEQHKRNDVGGIYALDSYEDGRIVGLPFPDDLVEFHGWGYQDVFYHDPSGKKRVFHNSGDKKFIGVTKVIQRYPPIPVFPGERYHSLYYKQHLIERDYTILIYNHPVCVVKYMEDGSSNNMYFQYVKNPLGFCNERKFVMKYAPSFKIRFRASIHYVAESLLAKDYHFIKNATNKTTTLLALPLGILLYFWIKRKTKK